MEHREDREDEEDEAKDHELQLVEKNEQTHEEEDELSSCGSSYQRALPRYVVALLEGSLV